MSAPDSPAAGHQPRVLLLCHRIPYPPDKGDKIRSWRWLQALAEQYRVTLAAFVDDPEDLAHAVYLRPLCERLLLLPLSPRAARMQSLPALLTGVPLSVRYYRDRRLAAWVAAERARGEFERVVVYSSAMAQYVLGPEWAGVRRVLDFVDVDSDKWRQYALQVRGPMALVYRREARRLLAFDLAAAMACDLSLFVSASEAGLFCARLRESGRGGSRAAVAAVGNGVDAGYFAPDPARASPFAADRATVVFTGAMDYWANVDAVTWMVREVWPRVMARCPDTQFFIVGARPTAAVTRLAGPSVVVTGRVPDVRPYLQHAGVVVAPMRIARGVQNKVLEGMAMARPMVTTSLGLEGLALQPGLEVLVADDGPGFAQQIIASLRAPSPDLGPAARAAVAQRYDWHGMTRRFLALVDGRERGEECA